MFTTMIALFYFNYWYRRSSKRMNTQITISSEWTAHHFIRLVLRSCNERWLKQQQKNRNKILSQDLAKKRLTELFNAHAEHSLVKKIRLQWMFFWKWSRQQAPQSGDDDIIIITIIINEITQPHILIIIKHPTIDEHSI